MASARKVSKIWAEQPSAVRIVAETTNKATQEAMAQGFALLFNTSPADILAKANAMRATVRAEKLAHRDALVAQLAELDKQDKDVQTAKQAHAMADAVDKRLVQAK